MQPRQHRNSLKEIIGTGHESYKEKCKAEVKNEQELYLLSHLAPAEESCRASNCV
jgi:hypothetical protein